MLCRRPQSLGLALATFVGLGIACDESEPAQPSASPPIDAPIEPTPIEPPKTAVALPQPVVDTALELHVVATRRGSIALSIAHGVELAIGGVEPVTLHTAEPLVREPRFLEGVRTLTEGLDEPAVDLVKLGGRWPNEATLIARVSQEYVEGTFTRAIRWNGSGWERDDPIVRGLKRYYTPIGPFELGTTLVLPTVEHTSPGKRGWLEALERAKPKQLVRRLVDGTTTPGPAVPGEEYSRYASTPDGWVFAATQRIAMWSPGATAWQTTELPDGEGVWIAGFVANAKDDVYAYGVRGLDRDATRGGYIAHYDGKTWQAMDAPPCFDGISRFAPGRPTSWAHCASEGYESWRPPLARELWRTAADGKWERVTLALDSNAARVRVGALAPDETPPTIDKARPRATDVAIAADGTLWLSMSEQDGVSDDEPATWTLARSSIAGPVLVLPSDAELFARVSAGP